MNTKSLRSLFFLVILVCAKGLTAYSQDCCDDYSRAYLRAEGGVSFSTTTTIGTKEASNAWPTLAQISQTASGDNANNLKTDLGRAGLVGLHVGYNVARWLSLDLGAEFRGSYKFRRQVVVSGPAAALATQGYNFNLDNNAYTLNFFFNRVNGASCWSWDICSMSINPYVGVGFGWSRNALYNFYVANPLAVVIPANSGLVNADFATTAVSAVLPYYVNNTFAWNVQLGLDWNFNNCFGLGLGYRYFDGGRFKTANHTSSNGVAIDGIEGLEGPIDFTASGPAVAVPGTVTVTGTIPASENSILGNNALPAYAVPQLRGKLRAHEFVAALTWNF